ncbi:MAG: beta-glycosidase [Tannerella sp.]|jgi:glucosylceramidase|nr:beta-glycosidase [Tannerella sp.]
MKKVRMIAGASCLQAGMFILLAFAGLSCSTGLPKATLVTTTEDSSWELQSSVAPSTTAPETVDVDVLIDPLQVQQSIEGFGTCFNELGWTSLSLLDESAIEDIMVELFRPGAGANFTICRMPVAANDFSRDWYSYNETEGDFAMENFSIENDRQTLLPFIKTAREYMPALKIWASPWSPPSWMKHNKHYAACSSSAVSAKVDNGLPEDRQGKEGTDMFICEEPYLKAYALYFAKFIDAYNEEGIRIFAVMPQNEFNSAQIFPSCCWTAAGLTDFVGKYLGPAMYEREVEVMFGTMERPNGALVDTALNDPVAGKFIRGVGFQWAGKDALPGIYERYPRLRLYQTEQECGDGKNDWKGAVHSWNLMKHYMNNGISAYMYWNTSLRQGGISRWGWAQNSLIVVNEDGTYNYTPEYYTLKHVSHYVQQDARKLKVAGAYDDVLAFINPDQSIVVVIANRTESQQTLSIKVNGKIYTPRLKAKSLSTLFIRNDE